MSTYISPSGAPHNPRIFHDPSTILGVLGSLWTKTYGDGLVVENMAQTVLQNFTQEYLNLCETAACVSRFDIPLYHTENWALLELHRSGVRNDSLGCATLKLPGPVDVRLLMNRIIEPSVVLCPGTDFYVEKGYITFRKNPFDNPLIPQDGDGTLALWGFRAEYDYEYLYNHFGYLLGLRMSTSQEYKDTINAIMDALSEGLTLTKLNAILAIMTGTPLVKEPKEIVQSLSEDRRGPFVVTDHNVYRLPPRAAYGLHRGSELLCGQQLVPEYRVYEPGRGDDISEFTQLTLPSTSNAIVIMTRHADIDLDLLRQILPPELSVHAVKGP